MGPDFRTFIPRDGKPDLVFSNNVAFLNYGNLTASDHLAVVIKGRHRIYI